MGKKEGGKGKKESTGRRGGHLPGATTATDARR